MATMAKQLRIMQLKGVPTKVTKIEMQILGMTNWQNSQWLRDGAKPDRAEHFSKLNRMKLIK